MKNIMVAAFILTFSSSLFSQQLTPDTYSHHDDFMLKSRRKERAGIILLSCGATVTIGGTLLIIDGANRNHSNGSYVGGELNGAEAEIIVGALVAAMGVVSMSASIPFFVGAHNSRRKALSMLLKTEKMMLPFKTALFSQQYPAMAIHIPLGK
ncbi:MAG: hypothetical protein ABJB86_09450 [Bacteroidota bacterium]